MAVNLYKHREELLSAYKEVIDDNNPITWAVYGYDKDSNDLDVVTNGTQLENLADELDSSKILYAFVRVVDPKSGLIKYVLINWQGEGAALSRKGICANHIKDVNAFFRGAHVTINARNDDEVEVSVILDKVAKASSTKLDLKDRSDVVENTGPVGTNYQRVQAAKEINSSERESFWTKQQEEERKRKIEDRKRIEEERKHSVEQEKQREVSQAKEREASAAKKEQEISKKRELEKNAENRARDLMDVRTFTADQDLEEDPEEERTRRSEEARKLRALEARNLISGSKIKDAKALFEKHASAPVVPAKKPGLVAKNINKFNGTTQVVKKPTESASFAAKKESFEPSKVPKEAPTPVNLVKNTKKLFEQQPDSEITVGHVKSQINGKSNGVVAKAIIPAAFQSVTALEPQSKETLQSVTALEPQSKETKKEVPQEVVDKSVSPVVPTPSPVAGSDQTVSEADDEQVIASPEVNEEEVDDYIVHEDVQQPRRLSGFDLAGEHMLEDIAEEPEEDEHNIEHGIEHGSDTHSGSQPGPDGHGLKARALYDYQAADETEISFDPEDIITHVDMIDPGWYQGMAPDGSYGLFPANYVEIIQD